MQISPLIVPSSVPSSPPSKKVLKFLLWAGGFIFLYTIAQGILSVRTIELASQTTDIARFKALILLAAEGQVRAILGSVALGIDGIAILITWLLYRLKKRHQQGQGHPIP